MPTHVQKLPITLGAGAAEVRENEDVAGVDKPALQPPSSTSEQERKTSKTVVIISISYPCWWDKICDENMELTSVRNDLNLQLARHDYLHSGQHAKFMIFTDYDYQYTDSDGISAMVPHNKCTKRDILAGLARAAENGGSVTVYYSGHCARRGNGLSTLKLEGDLWIYEETGLECAGPPYIIAGDGQRIYGEEFHKALTRGIGTQRDMTITLVFDTCNASTYFDFVFKFPCVYRIPPVEGSKSGPKTTQKSQNQVIFLTATQFGEKAGTFRMTDKKEHGAVTLLMSRFFNETSQGSRSAQALVERLHGVCYTRQTPQIQALSPISGDFMLLA
ncbi:hypothetical protein FRB90_000138 [Tulasnella sp. 427]|nr:hypothetical protein FRB90_000138 [Tulasnella sp. 427]